MKLFAMFSYKSFIVLAFIYRSLIHFDLILLHVDIQFSHCLDVLKTVNFSSVRGVAGNKTKEELIPSVVRANLLLLLCYPGID